MCLQDLIDYGSKVALVVIAVCNLWLAIHSFFKKRKEDAVIKESDRRIDWVKSLILTPNLHRFYSFFDNLGTTLEKLKTIDKSLPDEEKARIDSENSTLFIQFRKEFMLLFSSVDENIYQQILNQADNLQSSLTNTIFDDTLDFNSEGILESNVMQLLSDSKRDILRILFSYRGTSESDMDVKEKFNLKQTKYIKYGLMVVAVAIILIFGRILYTQANRIHSIEIEVESLKNQVSTKKNDPEVSIKQDSIFSGRKKNKL